jgi:hypothetical protein
MKKWGLGTWGDTTIDTDMNVQTYINNPAFAYDNLDKNYKDWKTNTNKYFRILTARPQGGNSGGPHGVFFNRTTGEVGPEEKCYAIVGTTSNGKVIISASHWIPWLRSLGIKVNIAHYNPDGKITIIPPPPLAAEAPVQAAPPPPPPAPPAEAAPLAEAAPVQEETKLEFITNKKRLLDKDFAEETASKDDFLARVKEIRKNIAELEGEDSKKLTDKQKETIIDIKTNRLERSVNRSVTTIENFIDIEYRKISLRYQGVLVLLQSILDNPDYKFDDRSKKKIDSTIGTYYKIKENMNQLQKIIQRIEGTLVGIHSTLLTDNLGGSRKNHLTRKQHWTRSKPSRFKTHRIY